MLTQTLEKELFPLTAEVNSKGHLCIAKIDVLDLVEKYGSPLYVIDEETFRTKSNEYINSLKEWYKDYLVLYAAKAFSSTSIFKLADKLGLGLDLVSGGEIYTALKANCNKDSIYFHGNNKSRDEINMAIKNKLGRIVCDNFHELELLQKIAKENNSNVQILIRLTPGIECHTHEYIKTGHLDSKFGFDLEYVDQVMDFICSKGKNLILKGFHAHIGSQIFELKPFSDTVEVLLDYFKAIKDKYNLELTEIDIGGGIGIKYTEKDDPITITDWAKTVSNTIKSKCSELGLKHPRLICEPGRSLIGPAGITLYKVGSIKRVPNGRTFVSVDGGMADNPRPITYQAKYSAVVANKMKTKETELVTIAGRYCETGDLLIKDITLPKVEPNDIIAISNTGAYNYSMSSNYNMVPRPACILAYKEKAEIIIEREDYDFLLKNHKIPERFK